MNNLTTFRCVDATAYSRSLVIPRIAVGGDGALTVRDTAFLQAAELQVSGDLVLRAGTFLIDSGSEETRGSGRMTSSGGFGGSSERTWNYLTITQIPSLIDVGGDVTLEATDGDGVIRASTVAGERVSISAEAGAVRFEGAYDTDFYQETKTGENFAFMSIPVQKGSIYRSKTGPQRLGSGAPWHACSSRS